MRAVVHERSRRDVDLSPPRLVVETAFDQTLACVLYSEIGVVYACLVWWYAHVDPSPCQSLLHLHNVGNINSPVRNRSRQRDIRILADE